MSWLLDRYGFLLRVRARSDEEAARKLLEAAIENPRPA